MTNKIGKEFVARKSFPKIERGGKTKDEDFSYDVQVGEKIVIKDFNGKHYTLWNISLDKSGLAWFKVNQEELDYLLRKCNTR